MYEFKKQRVETEETVTLYNNNVECGCGSPELTW